MVNEMVDITNLEIFIMNETLIFIPALVILGFFLKNSPSIPDWLIVWILTGLGILASVATLGFRVDSFVQGILVSGAAVLSHQIFKQTINK